MAAPAIRASPGTPVVSVIIPAFNSGRWIDETIRSVIDQTWIDLEVLVIDDGSTDDTASRVESISDARIRLIRQGRLGAAAARNRGIRESTGSMLQFVDADDILSVTKISAQIEALTKAPVGSIGSCAWCPFSGTTESATAIDEPVWREPDPVSWLTRSLSGEGMMQTAGWLIPRSVADRAGPWNESLTLHDDGEYFSRVLVSAAHNAFVEGPRVYYRKTAESLSRKRGPGAAESALEVCRLRHETLLSARDDAHTRRAVVTQYAQFAYEFATADPGLAEVAVRRIGDLGARPANVIGGRSFRALVKLAGFPRALKLKSVLERPR